MLFLQLDQGRIVGCRRGPYTEADKAANEVLWADETLDFRAVQFGLLQGGQITVDAEAAQRQQERDNPPEPPPSVPTTITMRQARLALLDAGLLDSVDAAIAAIPDATQRKAAQIEWEYAATVDRTSALVQTLGPALGLTEAQLDALYAAGAGL